MCIKYVNHTTLETQENRHVIEVPKGIIDLYELTNGQKFRIKTKEIDNGKILAIIMHTALRNE